jgi:pimeloyl-ACP methyl ester carboxylesterase
MTPMSRATRSSRSTCAPTAPPTLAVWGKNDPFFLPAGVEAFRRNVPEADVHFYDTGHFALETHHGEIAATLDAFLGRTLARR